MVGYTLTQASDPDAERTRLAQIQAYQDPATMRQLSFLGVGPGWRCVDVGAGSGSIAAWLADLVAPGGSVVATDLETEALQTRCGDRVDVRRHDIRTERLPEASFDLVHCRLLLQHLPEREDVLDRLRGAVRPGGLVVVGDIDFTAVRWPRSEPLFERVFDAFCLAATGSGWALNLGPRLPALLESHGLVHVEGECWQSYHRGGSPAAAINAMTFARMRTLLVATGKVTDADIDACVEHMHEPDFALFGPSIWTAWGYRPADTHGR